MGFGYDARGSRGSARTRKPSRQGLVTVDQCQQVDEEEDVDGHCQCIFTICTVPLRETAKPGWRAHQAVITVREADGV